jgi:hypothetical protein
LGSTTPSSRPFLRAGILGGIALAVLNLLGLLPVIGLCTFVLGFVVYAVAGAAAAHWIPPPRTTGQAAGQGALAGLITGFIGTIVQVLLTPLSISMSGGSQAFLRNVPQESLQQLEQVGIDPAALFSTGTFAGFTLICCLPVALIVGAGLGAIGGAVYAAMRPEAGLTTPE